MAASCCRPARRPLGVAFAGALLAVLVPKCPLCLAAYLSFLGAATGVAATGISWLRPLGVVRDRATAAPWSSGGDPTAGVLKPDLLAPATGILGAVPSGGGWDFVSGTSSATAFTSGVAAVLLGRTAWSPERVRSALVTTAGPLAGGSTLESGAGRVRPGAVSEPGLVYAVDPDDYRAWLDGRRGRLNTPSMLLGEGQSTARRTVTNATRRSRYFSSAAVGFGGDVSVSPAALRIAPGESATFRVRVGPRGVGRIDDGFVVWRGATGSVDRIPVLISR